jgi:hypothetical protein
MRGAAAPDTPGVARYSAGVSFAVAEGLGAAVSVGVSDGVALGFGVGVSVSDAVAVRLGSGVGVSVSPAVAVAVTGGVSVGVPVGAQNGGGLGCGTKKVSKLSLSSLSTTSPSGST